MKLSALIGEAGNYSDAIITGFAIDNRKVAPGTIFGAFQGATVNGEDFIDDAIAKGAIAIVAREQARVNGAFHIISDNPRQKFAHVAAGFFGPFPEKVAAVTGTNGKTSVAELSRQLWAICGQKSASIGTLGVTTSSDQVRTGLTTPDVVTFLSNMTGLSREGVTHVIFEASSHGLHQYRTEGIAVDIAAFTNLSRDHLDYHGDMDQYLTAKMRLFDEMIKDDGIAVFWADDPWSEKAMKHAMARDLKILSVGQNGHDIKIIEREPTQLGQKLILSVEEQEYKINLPLIGAYQASNALVSAAIAMASGIDASLALSNIHRLQPVSGRLERAAITKTGAPIYVDYAHTPDGLEAAIAALRPHTDGKLISIIGAGGDRDVGKRSLMGQVASEGSDIVIVTDDNPRTEDPAKIRENVMQGTRDAIEIGDRRSAISRAIEIAAAGDIILLAGKGHEEGQIIGNKILPFNDVQVARECAA